MVWHLFMWGEAATIVAPDELKRIMIFDSRCWFESPQEIGYFAPPGAVRRG